MMNKKQYFQNKTFLIVDPNKLIKPIVKKLMLDYGATPINQAPIGFQETLKTIIEHKPNFVFTPFELDKQKVIELALKHQEILPDRLESGYFILSEDNSMSAAASALEMDVDAFLSAPFTFQAIQETLSEIFLKKSQPTDFDLLVSKASLLIKKNQFDQASEVLDQALKKNSNPAQAFYLKGVIFQERNLINEAIEQFEEGLRVNSQHFKCLNSLLELKLAQHDYNSAYELSRIFIENFPISPKKLSLLIKLSIANEKYDDILNYAKLYSKIDYTDELTTKSLAAGLVLSAKSLFQSEQNDAAIKNTLKAIELSNDNLIIIKNACYLLLEYNQEALVEDILIKVGKNTAFSEAFKVFELEVMGRYAEPQMIVQQGMKYLQKGVRTPDIYSAVITNSIKVQRKRDLVEDLILEAKKTFPEQEEHYNSYLSLLNYEA